VRGRGQGVEHLTRSQTGASELDAGRCEGIGDSVEDCGGRRDGTAGQRVAGIVIDGAFAEHAADTPDDATGDRALDDHGVDHLAAGS